MIMQACLTVHLKQNPPHYSFAVLAGIQMVMKGRWSEWEQGEGGSLYHRNDSLISHTNAYCSTFIVKWPQEG